MRIIGLFIMFAIFTIVVLVTNPAQAYMAQSFDCGRGQQPIYAGDNEQNVLMKCGQPSYEEGDTWVYHRGQVSTIAVIFDGSATFRRKVLGIQINLKDSY